jgi:hypothetical protein
MRRRFRQYSEENRNGFHHPHAQEPRWSEFITALGGAVFPDDHACLCRHDYRYAEAIMVRMGGIDIPKSIAFFQTHGGYCDCLIIFDVDFDPRAKAEELAVAYGLKS